MAAYWVTSRTLEGTPATAEALPPEFRGTPLKGWGKLGKGLVLFMFLTPEPATELPGRHLQI